MSYRNDKDKADNARAVVRLRAVHRTLTALLDKDSGVFEREENNTLQGHLDYVTARIKERTKYQVV